MSSKDNLALDLEHGVRRWDRQRWISVFSSHSPTIREVTECLGLGLSASSSTTNRGIPKFDNPDYRKISSEVTKLSKELPKERDALLDFAADPHSLDAELEELLATYGPAIWGTHADRTCLLTPDPTKKTYNKHLFYDDAEHREILKIHLHRWIIIKACYYIRNMKLKRPSGANDYDTLADFDGEGGSQRGTPQSLSPPHLDASAGLEVDAKPLPNLKKRKSTAYLGGSLSDGEEHAPSPAKRPYNTLPPGRRSSTSPRKPLDSFAVPGDAGNTPPLPVRPFDQNHHLSPAPNAGPESARVELGSLSSNQVNGLSGSSENASVSAAAFTAVTPGTFTAVNTPPPPPLPPVREPSSEAPRAPSLDTKRMSPSQNRVEPRAYTSPYDTAAHGVTLPPVTPDPRSVPALSAASAPGQGFRTVNSPTPTNGLLSRESSVAQAVQHTQLAPQATSQPAPHPQSSPQSQAAQVKARSESQSQNFTPSRSHVPLHQQQASAQPPSRTHTPVNHHVGRSIAPHPSSRSSTPFAQDANTQPSRAHNQHIAPAPTETHAPIHGIRIVPAAASAGHAQAIQPPPPVPAAVQPPPVLAAVQPPQPVLKSQHVEVAPPHLPRSVAAVVDLRLLQCEVLALLIQYLFPRAASPPDEAAVLTRISHLWYHGEAIFRVELGPHYEMCSRILTAWLHERQAISSLRHSIIAQSGVSASGLIDRLLAMNDLRVMRLKWKNMSTLDGVSPEDLLCRTFAVMANTENTEHLFKDGLDRLNRGVFEFLRNEDAKIVMHRR
ncbi:uncharacterized protein EKO05_0004922 [Ascochyta rabiei]|uniref:Uncharacterized protein n=1 Tax=Didymella rabiei TaxID=5454 RepID=A0A163D639_DIDRA|nr:uncharacterized protein EKO05_0004922 [Ascochyta rabiei]KZM22938.1 hypothetical protein ST47_g5937 [Ascochyta rabiei]UPX14442.1 hypothetical protein EKO05_0004922 [Ascochyta rabiei]